MVTRNFHVNIVRCILSIHWTTIELNTSNSSNLVVVVLVKTLRERALNILFKNDVLKWDLTFLSNRNSWNISPVVCSTNPSSDHSDICRNHYMLLFCSTRIDEFIQLLNKRCLIAFNASSVHLPTIVGVGDCPDHMLNCI